MFAFSRILAALIGSVLLIILATFQSPEQSLPSKLVPVLFPENSDWQLGDYQGIKANPVVAQVDGQPVFQTGKSGLTLTSKKKLTGDVELRLRFRMTSPDDKGSHVVVRPGLAKMESP